MIFATILFCFGVLGILKQQGDLDCGLVIAAGAELIGEAFYFHV